MKNKIIYNLQYNSKFKNMVSKILIFGLCSNNVAMVNSLANSINMNHGIKNISNSRLNNWVTNSAAMPTSRSKFSTAVLGGKIYCIGGYNGSYLNKVEVYDTNTNKWDTSLAPMPTPRYDLVSLVVDGKIYCIGGYTSEHEATGVVEVYNPKRNTWETLTSSMPTPNTDFVAEVVDGKIYCIGGSTGVVQVYNPKTDKWETKSTMHNSTYGLTSGVVDGKIYCIGGSDGIYSRDYVNIYNPSTDKWTTGTSMITERHDLSSISVDGKIYCIGGVIDIDSIHGGGSNRNVTISNAVEVYNVSTDMWSTLTPSMPTSRYNFASEYVNGKIYCIGGYDGSYLNKVEAYVLKEGEDVVNDVIAQIEATKNKEDLENAKELVNNLSQSNIKDDFIERLNILEEEVILEESERLVTQAEKNKEIIDIGEARDLVNQLLESGTKDQLQDRLNNIFPNIASSETKSLSANTDIYIKMANTLSLSLDTTNITFDDFTGVEDMEKKNAVNLTVESSLPYEINVSLEDEIKSTSGTEVVDKSVLGIKANTENSYNTFTAVNTPITLLNSQEYGDINNHAIDLKLNKNIISKADVYKATIRFEVKQK